MLKSFIALTALAAAGAANAGVVTLFEDDFDSYTPALGITTTLGSKWTVIGNVDVVGTPNGFGVTCASGSCVDLDGTTGPGTIVSSSIAFAAGAPVTVSFDMSGAQRGSLGDTYTVGVLFAPGLTLAGGEFSVPGGAGSIPAGTVGGYFQSGNIAGNAPWTSYFLTFDPTTAGTLQVVLGSGSRDNIGPLLDNVRVTQAVAGVIPEPATWAMLIAGFGLVGMAARRRRGVAVAA
jgi:hypothetical protein